MKLTREVKIGMIVLLSFIILIWGMNFLKGRNLFLKSNLYYCVYSRVDGLTDASPIYYSGFKIGTVRDIKIHPTLPNKFLVTFTITEKVLFADNTVAELYSLDFMGAKAIQIKPGDSNRPLASGDTLISVFRTDFVDQMSNQMLPLKEKTENLIVKLDSSLTVLNTFVNADTKKHFDSSIRDLSIILNNMAAISQNLNQQMSNGGNIDQTIKHLNSLTTMLDSRKENIGKTIDNFSSISQKLSEVPIEKSVKTLDSTLTSLKNTLDGLNKGEGTMGMALKDKELYNNLTEATNKLNVILNDFQANPKRYVSFSAIHIGKKVDLAQTLNKGMTYSILLKDSPTQLDIAGKEAESGQVIVEEVTNNTYQYTTGISASYEQTEALLQRLKSVYPNAEIIAKENGKIIPLSKALQKSK